jgi:hypothetical protein
MGDSQQFLEWGTATLGLEAEGARVWKESSAQPVPFRPYGPSVCSLQVLGGSPDLSLPTCPVGAEAAHLPCPLPTPEEPSLLCGYPDPAEQSLPAVPCSPASGCLPAGPLHGPLQYHHLQAAVHCGRVLPPAGQ